jgi:hypothetical protein
VKLILTHFSLCGTINSVFVLDFTFQSSGMKLSE